MSEPDSRRSEVIQSVDTLCREFEAAWQADKRPDIGVFLDRVKDEQKESLLAKLILLDVAQRRWFGDTPSAAQYKARFPEYAQVIDEALGHEDRLGEFVWYQDNSGGMVHNVGRKLPTAFGLFDTWGNVWEWVGDPNRGAFCGLTYNSPARGCSERTLVFVNRNKYRASDVGFRIAKSLE